MKLLAWVLTFAAMTAVRASGAIEVTLDWLNRDGSREDGACTQIVDFTPRNRFVIIGQVHAGELRFLKLSARAEGATIWVTLVRQRRENSTDFSDAAPPIEIELTSSATREVLDSDFKYAVSARVRDDAKPNQALQPTTTAVTIPADAGTRAGCSRG